MLRARMAGQVWTKGTRVCNGHRGGRELLLCPLTPPRAPPTVALMASTWSLATCEQVRGRAWRGSMRNPGSCHPGWVQCVHRSGRVCPPSDLVLPPGPTSSVRGSHRAPFCPRCSAACATGTWKTDSSPGSSVTGTTHGTGVRPVQPPFWPCLACDMRKLLGQGSNLRHSGDTRSLTQCAVRGLRVWISGQGATSRGRPLSSRSSAHGGPRACMWRARARDRRTPACCHSQSRVPRNLSRLSASLREVIVPRPRVQAATHGRAAHVGMKQRVRGLCLSRVLLRLVDDFLLVTPHLTRAKAFLR